MTVMDFGFGFFFQKKLSFHHFYQQVIQTEERIL